MKKSLIIGFLLAVASVSNVFAGDFIKSENEQIKTHLLDEVVNTQSNGQIENGFDYRNLTKTNLNCGLAPLPPLGCVVGSCVCDQNGNNCQWQFICR